MLWRKIQRFAASLAASTGTRFVGIAALLLIFQAIFEYEKRTHDPTWALQYQKIWDENKSARRIAAKAIQEHREHLAEIDVYKSQLASIDDVLDILEDIGFYMEGNQISPETANHHFGYWIQGYWTFARPYIKAWQKQDPMRWEHIEPLFRAVCAIAKKADANPDFLALEIAE